MTWSDNVSVVATQYVNRGSLARGTLDLRTKKGAWLHCKIGRTGTTALDVGVDVIIRPLMNNGSATLGGPSAQSISFLSQTATASLAYVNTSSAAGQYELSMTGVTGFAAEDWVLVQTSSSLAAAEFQRISKATTVTATGPGLTTDSPLLYTYASSSTSVVTNRADVYNSVWLDPGSKFEVLFDYGGNSTGEAVVVSAMAQTWET